MSGDNNNTGPLSPELLGAIKALDGALHAFVQFAESLPALHVGNFAEEAASFKGDVIAHIAALLEDQTPDDLHQPKIRKNDYP